MYAKWDGLRDSSDDSDTAGEAAPPIPPKTLASPSGTQRDAKGLYSKWDGFTDSSSDEDDTAGATAEGVPPRPRQPKPKPAPPPTDAHIETLRALCDAAKAGVGNLKTRSDAAMAIAKDEWPPPRDLVVGAHVLVSGLATRCDLNGRVGQLRRWDANGGRWDVRLRGGHAPPLVPVSGPVEFLREFRVRGQGPGQVASPTIARTARTAARTTARATACTTARTIPYCHGLLLDDTPRPSQLDEPVVPLSIKARPANLTEWPRGAASVRLIGEPAERAGGWGGRRLHEAKGYVAVDNPQTRSDEHQVVGSRYLTVT